MVAPAAEALAWIALVYRVPREPSTPRIAIWRRLRSLGVAQLGDGVVALPEDARTREHMEWVADQVVAAGGSAVLLRAQTLTRKDERALAAAMSQARAAEYLDLVSQSSRLTTPTLNPAEATRVLRRLRKDLRAIQKRDYFPPAERADAVATVNRLAAAIKDPQRATGTLLEHQA